MGKHPLNLFIRLLLEVAAIVAVGMWGYNKFENGFRFLAAIGLPVIFAAIWGIFAVRDDPSRSGKTVVNTPGFLRLVIEIGLLGFAAWAWFDLGFQPVAWTFLIVLVVHYLVSYDRVWWLLKNQAE